MSSDDRMFSAGMMLGGFCGFVLGLIIGLAMRSDQIDSMMKKSIENGAAHYDTKTGAFTWKNEVTE